MTAAEKIKLTKTFAGPDVEVSDADVVAYLCKAENAILSVRYPWGRPENAAVEERWEMTQCELASRYILRKGGEGEISHSENGINRTYGSVDDADLLARITPYAKVI